MDNLLVRELLNAALIPLNFFIIAMISYQLIIARKTYGKGWTKRSGVASACAFWWIFVADFIRSCLAWNFLSEQSATGKIPVISSFTTLGYAIAGTIAVVATFRLLYTLSPSAASHRTWISAVVLTASFIAILYGW